MWCRFSTCHKAPQSFWMCSRPPTNSHAAKHQRPAGSRLGRVGHPWAWHSSGGAPAQIWWKLSRGLALQQNQALQPALLTAESNFDEAGRIYTYSAGCLTRSSTSGKYEPRSKHELGDTVLTSLASRFWAPMSGEAREVTSREAKKPKRQQLTVATATAVANRTL